MHWWLARARVEELAQNMARVVTLFEAGARAVPPHRVKMVEEALRAFLVRCLREQHLVLEEAGDNLEEEVAFFFFFALFFQFR